MDGEMKVYEYGEGIKANDDSDPDSRCSLMDGWLIDWSVCPLISSNE